MVYEFMYLHILFWHCRYGLIRYSRLVEVLATPFNLNFECAVLGVLFLSIFIVIGVYMTFGVSHDRWQIDHPNAIPTGTLFAVLGKSLFVENSYIHMCLKCFESSFMNIVKVF